MESIVKQKTSSQLVVYILQFFHTENVKIYTTQIRSKETLKNIVVSEPELAQLM